MMQTEIKIIQYLNGQSVNSFNIDLYDSVPIQVNKSIVDIKEPEKRKSDYTLSIRVPATANNRTIFSNIQNLNRSTKNTQSYNFAPDFNPNLKAEALVLRSGIAMMRGYLQLTEIPIRDEDVEYELVIIGKLANLFQDLGEKKLSEIDLSEFDHAWNLTNVANSWATYIIKNGNIYNNFVSGNPNGEGYVYPLIDNGLSTSNNEIEYELEKSMYPAIYVKQIVDKIFSEAGYRYESNFFDSNLFKRLIVPFTGGVFSNTEPEINDRTWVVDNSSTLTFVSSNTIISQLFLFDFDTIVQDTSPAGVDTSNDWVSIQSGNNGKYVIAFQGEITLVNNSGDTISGDAYVKVYLKVNRSGTIFTINPTPTKDANSLFTFTSVADGDSVTKARNEFSVEFELLSSDKVYVEFQYFNDTLTGSTIGVVPMQDMTLRIQTSTFTCSPSVFYSEGNNVNIGSSLPKEIKQKDFLTSIFRMFNLYAVPDQIDQNKLIIEPRDDFYTNDVVDLTNNLDLSREMIVKPMGVLDFRDLTLTYAKDSDEYNSKYQDLFKEVYGTKKYRVENDFLTETKQVDLIFSPSPLSNTLGAHDRVFTKIRKTDTNTQDSDVPAFNIRILYYGGLVSTSTNWTLKTKLAGLNTYSDFPYAGMLDNTANPTFDLSFAQPKAVYYGNGIVTYTNGNLFNRYWKKTIEEITDKDSKILTAHFKLNEVEFNALSFRKFYFIDQQYYRLYSLEHDLNSNEPVKIEFLKLKAAPNFALESGTGNGGSGGQVGGEELPIFSRTDNTKYFQGIDKVKFATQEQTASEIYLEFGSKINFVENSADVYLPDATLIRPDAGDPIVIVKNINGGSVKIYPLNTANLVNGGANYTLAHTHCVWFVAYKGNWQIINTTNTGGG